MRIIDWRGNPRYRKEYFLRKKPRRAPRPYMPGTPRCGLGMRAHSVPRAGASGVSLRGLWPGPRSLPLAVLTTSSTSWCAAHIVKRTLPTHRLASDPSQISGFFDRELLGKEVAFLSPPPLRTVRATFTAHGSSTEKPRVTGAGLDLSTSTFTILTANLVHHYCDAGPRQ
jgi:hypothetical protein